MKSIDIKRMPVEKDISGHLKLGRTASQDKGLNTRTKVPSANRVLTFNMILHTVYVVLMALE